MFVITGATGNIGRRLITALTDAGAPVRALSRHPETAEFGTDVEMVSSAAAALQDASAAFLNSRALGTQLQAFIDRAREAGVTRLVALSAINVDDDFSCQPSRFIGDRNKEVEQYVIASGLEWVSLRPAQFASALADIWAAQTAIGDDVSGPYAAASSASIADEDVAAVAAQALLTDDLVGEKVVLTGPQALTNAESVEVVGEVLHRGLRYIEVSAETVRQRFLQRGFPIEFADAYLTMQADTLEKPALVTSEVERILGRPAVSWRQWVSDHRDVFTERTAGNKHE